MIMDKILKWANYWNFRVPINCDYGGGERARGEEEEDRLDLEGERLV